jgi:hypothetical protein
MGDRHRHSFLRYPTRKVIGVVDTPADLEGILQALADAGIAREDIKVFSGEEGSAPSIRRESITA